MGKRHSLNEAKEIIEAYDAFVERAIDIVSHAPFYWCIENENSAKLRLEGEEAVLTWSYYESDYYGGGSLSDGEARCPANLLFLSDAEFSAFKSGAKQEEEEKAAKVLAAQAAAARERQEANDRAEFARLCAKYGKSLR